MATFDGQYLADDHPWTLFTGRGCFYLNQTMRGEGSNEEFQKLMGEKLRTLRREAGLSQRGLAQKLNLSHQQVQKYERGENALPLQRVKSFAAALRVSPAILAFPEVERPETESAARLSSDETELLKLFNNLPDRESRRRLLDLLRALGKFAQKAA